LTRLEGVGDRAGAALQGEPDPLRRALAQRACEVQPLEPDADARQGVDVVLCQGGEVGAVLELVDQRGVVPEQSPEVDLG
ncbi:hypothetical protein DF186_24115, partial [Enterococcus hirae]